MNAVKTNEDNEQKIRELLAHIKKIESEKGTARLEIHFKDGRIASGNLYLPIMK